VIVRSGLRRWCLRCLPDDVEIEIETPTTETRNNLSLVFFSGLRGEMKLMELNNRRVLVVGLGKSAWLRRCF